MKPSVSHLYSATTNFQYATVPEDSQFTTKKKKKTKKKQKTKNKKQKLGIHSDVNLTSVT